MVVQNSNLHYREMILTKKDYLGHEGLKDRHKHGHNGHNLNYAIYDAE